MPVVRVILWNGLHFIYHMNKVVVHVIVVVAVGKGSTLRLCTIWGRFPCRLSVWKVKALSRLRISSSSSSSFLLLYLFWFMEWLLLWLSEGCYKESLLQNCVMRMSMSLSHICTVLIFGMESSLVIWMFTLWREKERIIQKRRLDHA